MNRPKLQSSRLAALKSDSGSVLMVGLMLTILLLLVSTLGVNIATLWTTRTTLNAIADSAALSGARAIDVEAIYRSGQATKISLDAQEAKDRVKRYLKRQEVKTRLQEIQLTGFEVHGAEVTVSLSCIPRMPFGYLLPSVPSIVRTVAHAQNLAQ